ncbi:copper-binding protein [Rhodocaloribacter sp.]
MTKNRLWIAAMIVGLGLAGCTQKSKEASGPAATESPAETATPLPPDAAPVDHNGETALDHEAMEEGDGTAREEAEVQTFEGTGVVKNITPSKSHIIIEHKTIPGFMNAMTMPFRIEDQTVLEGIARGDSIDFVLTVAGNDVYVSAIEKVDE